MKVLFINLYLGTGIGVINVLSSLCTIFILTISFWFLYWMSSRDVQQLRLLWIFLYLCCMLLFGFTFVYLI